MYNIFVYIRLPSMSDVEKKRQILTYSTFIRKQFLKLLALVKWAENAKDIQMCQVTHNHDYPYNFLIQQLYIEYYGISS